VRELRVDEQRAAAQRNRQRGDPTVKNYTAGPELSCLGGACYWAHEISNAVN
jgi:hypothetical protein